jgi:hypothetical protein
MGRLQWSGGRMILTTISFCITVPLKEITMEFKLKNESEPNRQIEAEELIFDQNKLIFLGRLYHSLVSKTITHLKVKAKGVLIT